MRFLSILIFVALAANSRADDTPAALYAKACANCHGDKGQGSKKHATPLAGGKSIAQLADVIQKTMPEDAPGSLSKEQSNALATYIHGAFYSDIARDRIKPARIELARLTVRQYRLAVADLFGSFRPAVELGEKHGLSGEYFNRTFQMDFNGKGVAQRVDDMIAFDLGTASPWPEKLEHHSFSVKWRGSIIAPDTGEYEFAIRTEHAGRLFVNDMAKPIIDAWVKSGKATEFRGRIWLVGGRAYPIRVEYSKGRQGRSEKEKKEGTAKEEPKTASSIHLLWKRPAGTLEPVATRHLVPVSVPEQFICATKFPPDDRSTGWERGSTVSREWDAATTEAALEVVTYFDSKTSEFLPVKVDDPKRVDKCKAFVTSFAERAFQRPLTTEQKAIIVEKQFATAKSPEAAVKRAMLLVLKSPFFLYREVQGGDDAIANASRLSFILWDTLPDKALLAGRASDGTTRDSVSSLATKMASDPRATAKLNEFLLTWLRLDQPQDVMKDANAFPGFDADAMADLRTSLELSLTDVLDSKSADYRQLFKGDSLYLNHRLARLYKFDVKPHDGFKKMTLDGGQRAGVLTHPYLMAAFANNKESSPIHRGVFLARGILGVSLRPPPEAVAPLAPELHPSLTTRERVVLQTNAAACMTCHGVINPLGFTLEHFDAVGRLREKDHAKPIDARGSYRTHAGTVVQVNGARELAEFIVKSDEAHEAFVEQLFHHLVKQPVRAYGPKTLDRLRESFVNNDFNIRTLAAEIAVTVTLAKAR